MKCRGRCWQACASEVELDDRELELGAMPAPLELLEHAVKSVSMTLKAQLSGRLKAQPSGQRQMTRQETAT